MSHKQQNIFLLVLVGAASIFSFQSLIVIANLNQISLLISTAIKVWLWLCLLIFFLFDLHFKNPGALSRARQKHVSIKSQAEKYIKIFFSALWDRLSHLRKLKEVKQFLIYLLLPGFLFWPTVIIIFSNLGRLNIQQLYAWVSTIAFAVVFWYLKESLHRKKEKVDSDIFIAYSVAKIYAVTITFGAGMELLRSYCLAPEYFAVVVLASTFLLFYQALYLHKAVNLKSLSVTLLVSLFMGGIGFFVYKLWGFNFFSGAIFMSAFYNFFWGTYHFHLDHGLNKKAFLEILLICFMVAYLVFLNTNFNARILDGCVW